MKKKVSVLLLDVKIIKNEINENVPVIRKNKGKQSSFKLIYTKQNMFALNLEWPVEECVFLF